LTRAILTVLPGSYSLKHSSASGATRNHPEAKSLAPDGSPCKADTTGVLQRKRLQRAHIVAGEFRFIGKETAHKWEEGDDLSVTDFAVTEFGRAKKVADVLGTRIREIGINNLATLSKRSKHTILRLAHGKDVRRTTRDHVLRIIQSYDATNDAENTHDPERKR
jgi:hypothetical protein